MAVGRVVRSFLHADREGLSSARTEVLPSRESRLVELVSSAPPASQEPEDSA